MTSPTDYLPPTGRRLWHYILGFGVGIGVGLAPFLGRVKVPGFSALLDLYPLQMQQYLIPLSAFLLGTIAVAVQYYSAQRRSAAILDRYFRSLIVSLLGAFLILVVLYTQFVLPVKVEETGEWVHVVISWSRSAGCCPGLEDLDCIKQRSLDPAAIDSCWKHLPLVKLALSVPYLFSRGSFPARVGLLLFREQGQEPRQPARASV